MFIEDCIEPTILAGEDREEAITRITKDWARIIEAYIRKYPDQWAWTHNRWKTKKASQQ